MTDPNEHQSSQKQSAPVPPNKKHFLAQCGAQFFRQIIPAKNEKTPTPENEKSPATHSMNSLEVLAHIFGM